MQMHNKHPGNLRSAVVLLGALTVTCKEPDPMVTPPQTGPRLTVERVTTRANVAEQMRAAIEMQHSGEPLAETMGRDVAGYDRNALLPDQYTDPATGSARLDIAGYSTAVESYEYSKLAMNTLSFESGAGLSLMYGPVLNSGGVSGAAALKLLVDRDTDRVLGFHGVGPDTGEMAQLVGVALQLKATKSALDATLAVHPTAAEELVTMRKPTVQHAL